MRKKIFLGVLFFLNGEIFISAQVKWDTTKYHQYSDKFVLSVFTSYRQFDYSFAQKNVNDNGKSILHYLADANSVSGMEIDYDKISFSIGFKSSPNDPFKKGKTDYKNFAFSFGDNKWLLETSYRKFTGFYEENTGNYDTAFTAVKPYYQNPGMSVEQLKGKFMYFTNNKKFAFKAGYSGTYRQIRSAFSWILGGNFYFNHMRADTSFIPPLVRNEYGEDAYLKNLNVSGLSLGVGASFNLVIWKRFFANVTYVQYLEPQWRKYMRENGPNNSVGYISVAGDFRGSIGFNAKNFFITANTFNDFVIINSKTLEITSKYVSGSFSFGYRFKVKPPGFYKKFQETKIYKWL